MEDSGTKDAPMSVCLGMSLPEVWEMETHKSGRKSRDGRQRNFTFEIQGRCHGCPPQKTTHSELL
jgi:hypothetical protein